VGFFLIGGAYHLLQIQPPSGPIYAMLFAILTAILAGIVTYIVNKMTRKDERVDEIIETNLLQKEKIDSLQGDVRDLKSDMRWLRERFAAMTGRANGESYR
jgi:hypothetical protein